MTPRVSPLCRLLAVVLLLLGNANGAIDLASLENAQAQAQAVAAKASASVVALSHGVGNGFAMGSGVIITPEGLILTAAHVVPGKGLLEVMFTDGKRLQAKVLGANYDRDVALALITERGNYPFAELGDTRTLAVGEMVVALGHPGGFDAQRKPPVRFGRVFGFDRDRYIRSDCVLASGDSGGPLFNLSGKVIGVHSSVGADMSVNNDTPIDVVHRDWERLMNGDRWGTSPLGVPPKFSKRELAGLDLDRFRERVLAEGTKNKGWFEADPKVIARWLGEYGMRKDRLRSMDSPALLAFLKKALGGLGEVTSSPDLLKKAAAPKQTNPEHQGLDLDKFRERVIGAAGDGGQIAIAQDMLVKWLRECGMSEKRLAAITPDQLSELLQSVLAAAMEPTPNEKTIIDQDEAVVAAIKPGLDKITPSVVRLMNDRQAVSLGTIVHESGVILTKHSEVARAKDKLRARLADGRTFSATVVRQFPDHDLALVKIEATALPAIKIPDDARALLPGNLLFTPAAHTEDPMLAMGVVSVASRPLRESGGYLGVALGEADGSIHIRSIIARGPAERAGLKPQDRILSVDDITFQRVDELSNHLRSLSPKTKVRVTYRRARDKRTVEVALGDRAELPARRESTDPGTRLGTEISERRSGYPLIFQHDQPLKPEECGSVVVDLHGNIVGVNIARVARVETYAIPADVVARLLASLDLGALGSKASTGN